MRTHVAAHVDDDPAALVFTGPKGGPIWRGNFRKLTTWRKVFGDLGLDGVRFHELRHTGNTLAARSGVSTRDLMARMGHDSVRAAIIYQHATAEADARIAQALEVELSAADDNTDDDGSEPETDPDDGAAT